MPLKVDRLIAGIVDALKYEKNGPSSSPEFFNPILINDTEDNQLKEDDENKLEN